jgi:hypothetical protein
MWRRVDLVWTDVSEERIASNFRIEKSASEEPTSAGEGTLQQYTVTNSQTVHQYIRNDFLSLVVIVDCSLSIRTGSGESD